MKKYHRIGTSPMAFGDTLRFHGVLLDTSHPGTSLLRSGIAEVTFVARCRRNPAKGCIRDSMVSGWCVCAPYLIPYRALSSLMTLHGVPPPYWRRLSEFCTALCMYCTVPYRKYFVLPFPVGRCFASIPNG